MNQFSCIQNQISKFLELKPISKYSEKSNYVFAFEQIIVVADFENPPHSNLFSYHYFFYQVSSTYKLSITHMNSRLWTYVRTKEMLKTLVNLHKYEIHWFLFVLVPRNVFRHSIILCKEILILFQFVHLFVGYT